MSRDLTPRRLGIVGPGRLGASLARDVVAAGLPLTAVAGGAPGRAARLVGELPVTATARTAVLEPEALVAAVDVVWLCVPDAAVPGVAARLPFRAGQLVVHCSGVLGLDALAPARARGAAAGCLHPLQSFAAPAGELGRFRGVTCGVEADPPHDAWLAALCAELGARALSLAGVRRDGYHAAAVFASNALVALYAAAERAFVAAGLPAQAAREALLPLSRGTLDNLAERAPAAALTGPLVRGDVASVAAHIDALASDPAVAEAYRALSKLLLELPLPLDAAQRAALARVLDARE